MIGERQNLIFQPQASFFIMDQHTGEVKALCGGRGEKTASLTLNRATNVYRQPGSSFKVITSFAPALIPAELLWELFTMTHLIRLAPNPSATGGEKAAVLPVIPVSVKASSIP